MNNKRAFISGGFSDFYCTKCGNKGIPIYRTGRIREQGHLKGMYCMHCKETRNFAEVQQCGNYTKKEFMLEFKYGNFDGDGNRINPSYKNFIAILRKDGVIE